MILSCVKTVCLAKANSITLSTLIIKISSEITALDIFIFSFSKCGVEIGHAITNRHETEKCFLAKGHM